MKEKIQNPPKTLWIFNHYAITPQYPGGTRHFELGRNLSNLGTRVIIFASSFVHMNLRSIPQIKKEKYKVEQYENLLFIWVKALKYKNNNWKRLLNMLHYCLSTYMLAKRLVKKGVLNKPDVIVGSTVHPFAPLMASRLARKYRVPFLFEIRDLWPQSFIDVGIWTDSSLPSWFFKRIEKRSISRALKIIILSLFKGFVHKQAY